MAHELIKLLDSGTASDGVAKKVSDWLIGELQLLGTKALLGVLDAILGGLCAALEKPPALRSFHLLPTVVSLLATLDSCAPTTMADGRVVRDGASIATYALGCVLRTPWAAVSLVPLATMLRDINLPTEARSALVGKLTSRLGDLEPNQMPALVYQLLLLADADGKARSEPGPRPWQPRPVLPPLLPPCGPGCLWRPRLARTRLVAQPR